MLGLELKEGNKPRRFHPPQIVFEFIVILEIRGRKEMPQRGVVGWGDAPAPAASLWSCPRVVLALTCCVLGYLGCGRAYPQGEGAGTGRGPQGCILVAPIPCDNTRTWGRNPSSSSSSSPGPCHHPASSESTVLGKSIGAKREPVINLGQPNPTPGIAGLGKAGYAGTAAVSSPRGGGYFRFPPEERQPSLPGWWLQG